MTTLTRLGDALLGGRVLAETMADAGVLRTLDLTGPAAVRPFVIKGLADAGRTVLAVTATAREAEDLVAELGDLVDPATVAYYPSWETLPHERMSPRSDTVGRRLAVLRRLRHPGTDVSNGPVRVIVATMGLAFTLVRVRAISNSTQLNMKQKKAATPTPALISGMNTVTKKRGKE